jgi:hypothetical protein
MTGQRGNKICIDVNKFYWILPISGKLQGQRVLRTSKPGREVLTITAKKVQFFSSN